MAAKHKGMNVGVFGLGNVLMGDDALGPTVIAHLRAQLEFPSTVTVDDLGTPGFDLYSQLVPFDAVIIVDTVRDDGPPGTVRTYTERDILTYRPSPRLGPRDPALKQTLLNFGLSNAGPGRIDLVGVVPAFVDHVVRLDPAVESAVPTCVGHVRRLLTDLGIAVADRIGGVVELWWSKRPEVASAKADES